MTYSRGNRSHPSDKNNTDAKDIMSTNEPYLPKIPDGVQSLTAMVDIDDNCCTYCAGVPSDGKLSYDEIVPCKHGGRYDDNIQKGKNHTVKELRDMVKERKIHNRSKLTTKDELRKVLDIDIPNKSPNHLNVTRSCKKCNMSKNDLKDHAFFRWIRYGPKNGNGSYVPRENQEIIIKWYIDNTPYIRTDNTKILDHIKESEEMNRRYWIEKEQFTKKIVI